MKTFFTLFLLLTSSFSANSSPLLLGGDHAGNGGDICELKFMAVKDDLLSWVKGGGVSQLKLSPSISPDEYTEKMIRFMESAVVSCTDKQLLIGSAEKTCINSLRSGQEPKIVCNFSRFQNTDVHDRYVLVHHEYAGLAGFEQNSGETSNYLISNQLVNIGVDYIHRLRSRQKPSDLPNGVMIDFGGKPLFFSEGEESEIVAYGKDDSTISILNFHSRKLSRDFTVPTEFKDYQQILPSNKWTYIAFVKEANEGAGRKSTVGIFQITTGKKIYERVFEGSFAGSSPSVRFSNDDALATISYPQGEKASLLDVVNLYRGTVLKTIGNEYEGDQNDFSRAKFFSCGKGEFLQVTSKMSNSVFQVSGGDYVAYVKGLPIDRTSEILGEQCTRYLSLDYRDIQIYSFRMDGGGKHEYSILPRAPIGGWSQMSDSLSTPEALIYIENGRDIDGNAISQIHSVNIVSGETNFTYFVNRMLYEGSVKYRRIDGRDYLLIKDRTPNSYRMILL